MAFGRSSPPPPPAETAGPPTETAGSSSSPGLTPDDLVAAVNRCAKQIFMHTDGPWQNVDPNWIAGQMMHALDLLRWLPMRPANANAQNAGGGAPPKGKAN